MTREILSAPGQGYARPLARLALIAAIIVSSTASGCGKHAARAIPAQRVPKVSLVRPARSSVFWTVQQPAYIESFEETPIVPKISGYVQQWHVDIGDHVTKGQTLAVLWVPDMVAELKQRKVEIQQAQKLSDVADAHVASARALVTEAQAGLRRARADADYCKLQHDRITQLAQTAVVNKQVKDESWKSLESAEAGVKEAEAKLVRAEAEVRESEAALSKTRADVAVAEAAAERMQALLDYSRLTAPFDGVVTRRNVNTGDFVNPPNSGAETALYVVERRDVMRVFVEVPEADSVWVKAGTPAHIRVPILRDEEYCGGVKRMAYALKRQSRTLLAEIDLPNPHDRLRPGMYAYSKLRIEQKDALTLPTSAVATRGSVNEGYEEFCFLVENGKVRRTPVQVGSRGEGRVQILKRYTRDGWREFQGSEIVVGNGITALADGQNVIPVASDVALLRPQDRPSPTRP